MGTLPTGRPVLRMLSGPRAGSSFEIMREATTLGRGPACDIVLALKFVSRRHARILRRPDGYYLEDLRSGGGTQLNGRPVRAPIRLSPGDQIRIVDCLFTFCRPAAEETAPGDDGTTIL